MQPTKCGIHYVEYDPRFECLYIQLSPDKVSTTIEHSDHINIDLDKKGGIVGIEFVGVKHGAKHFNAVFSDLGKIYNRPELKEVPKQLKQNLSRLVA